MSREATAKKVRRARATAKTKTAARAKPAAKVGRPEKVLPIEAAKVGQLATMGLTDLEIADVLDVSTSTLHARFRVALKRGRGVLHQSLRHRQVALAMGGNVTMLIWLGKNLLDQTDRLRQETIDATPHDRCSTEPCPRCGAESPRHGKDRVAAIMRDDEARAAYNKLCDRLNELQGPTPPAESRLHRRATAGGNGDG
jgi:hypothetical protein